MSPNEMFIVLANSVGFYLEKRNYTPFAKTFLMVLAKTNDLIVSVNPP